MAKIMQKVTGEVIGVRPLGGRIKALILALFMAFACTGCTVSSVDELYSLPEMSEEYVQLRELIGQRINAGSVYAAPTGGSNLQSVQLQDLDGDGVAEALAFLADENRTPTVCIYRQNDAGDYYLYVIVTGDGSAVASVEYADMNGDGAMELIIAWQISGDIRLLSAYSLSGGISAELGQLFSADCTEFLVCDLDADGAAEILDLRLGDRSGTMVMYSVDEEGQIVDDTAKLSDGVTAVRRAVRGTLSDGTAAVFVESDMDGGGVITDVFAAPDGQVKNLTMAGAGRSNTYRAEEVFSMDINGDGATELPRGDGEFFSWYGLDSSGNETASVYTCYNRTDGWYLTLAGELSDRLTLERYGSGGEEPAVVFTLTGDGTTPSRSVLVIYAVTGENRMDRATADGRFVLLQEDETVYAAQLLTDELTQEEITENFHLIYAEWQTGDL